MKGASAGAPGDPPWRRLFRFDLDWTKLADLVWPELPVTLHIRESLPGLDPQVSGGLETAWVLVCWTGCLLTVVGVMERRFRKRGDGGSLVASLLPVGFTLAFAASYLALEVKIRIADPAFSEYRQASHRILPPLLVAMAVGAAPGWVWLCRRWGDLSLRGVRRPLQALTVLVALAPASIGLLSQAHIAAQAPGRGDAGFDIYRGSCFDPSGFFHVGHHRDRAGAEAHCSTLSSPEREQECLVGVAMGLGFYGARLGGPGEWPDDRGDDPCDHAPPDFARRCSSWSPAESPDLGPELEEICRSVHPSLRAACFRGAGWYSSQVVWGGDLWPIAACDALAEEADRVSCWGGPGFQLGDHMGHTPGRIADLLERVPAHRRDAVARGVGLAQGTQWSAEHIAHGVCDALGADLAAACKLGVADGRGYAHPR
jgi:hypothetical protein